jgi:hypothetical protein
MRRATLALAALLACSGCSYSMHEYQAGGYAASPVAGTGAGAAPKQAEWIHARANQNVVLGITNNTRYVDEAYDQLLSQCSGEIVGVNTRYSTRLSFLSYENTVDVQAFCLR